MFEDYKQKTKWKDGWMIQADFTTDSPAAEQRQNDGDHQPLMMYVGPKQVTSKIPRVRQSGEVIGAWDPAPEDGDQKILLPGGQDSTMLCNMNDFKMALSSACGNSIGLSFVSYEKCTQLLTSEQSAMSDKERGRLKQVCGAAADGGLTAPLVLSRS